MDIVIRRGEIQDALFLTSISFGAKRHWNYSDTYLEAWHEQLTVTEDYIRDNTVFIAQKKNTIIGYCSIVEATEDNMDALGFSKPGFWLDHIYIRPAYIENGIGTQLIEAVNTYCEENEITSLLVEADPHANGFFEKLGADYLGEIQEDLEDHLSLFEYKVLQKQEQADEKERKLPDQIAETAVSENENISAQSSLTNEDIYSSTDQDKDLEKSEERYKELEQEALQEQNDSQGNHEAEEPLLQEDFQEQADLEKNNEVEEPHQQEDSQEQVETEENEEAEETAQQKEEQEKSEVGPKKWTLSSSDSEDDQKFNFNAYNVNYQLTEDPYLLAKPTAEGKESFYGEAKEEIDQEDDIFSFSNLSIKPIQEDTEKRRMRLDQEVLEQKMRELDGEPDAETEEDMEEIQEDIQEDTFNYHNEEQDSDEKLDDYIEEGRTAEEIVAEADATYTVDMQKQAAEEDVEAEQTAEGFHVKTEKEKMIVGDMYIEWGDEIANDKKKARNLLREFNQTDVDDKKTVSHLLKKLFGTVGEFVHIEPDFKCSYGYNIHIGDNFYAGPNCVILDNCPVKIGKNCILSPQVGIYTQSYPMEAEKRIAGYEYAQPVTIGDNVWIGGGSIINPGVKIGDNVVIAPGSVVVTDIPDNSFASGNPAKVINKIVN